MKIINHRLYSDDDTALPFRPSPNIGAQLSPQFIIMHYTAGSGAEQSINWLCNPASAASAHVVIARDGSVSQLVPFDTVAWHAGKSQWLNLSGMNRYSIGIELDNAGPLTRVGDQWVTWFGAQVPTENVLEARHKNRQDMQGWQTYTVEQLYAAFEVCAALMQTYGIQTVLGHEDIAPQRKTDPGPAFPMDAFRSHLAGRKEETAEDEPPEVAQAPAPEKRFATTALLNIRTGPGSYYDLITGGPLPKGTLLRILATDGLWHHVDVLSIVNGINNLEGWIHSRYVAEL